MALQSQLKIPVVVGSVMVLMVVARVYLGSSTELNTGKSALEAGETSRAIVHLDRAIQWYVPLAPTVGEAAALLWKVGQEADARGDTQGALEAFRALRGAFHAVRGINHPGKVWIDRANERIATLQASDNTAAWPDPSLSREERKQVALDVLQRDPTPDPGWSALAVVGFLGWVGSGLGFFLRGFEPSGRFLRKSGLRWGLGVLGGYFLWIIALLRA